MNMGLSHAILQHQRRFQNPLHAGLASRLVQDTPLTIIPERPDRSPQAQVAPNLLAQRQHRPRLLALIPSG